MKTKKLFSAILTVSMLGMSLPMAAEESDTEETQQQQNQPEEPKKRQEEKKESIFGKWYNTLWKNRSKTERAGIGLGASLIGLWSLFNIVPTVYKYTVKPLFKLGRFAFKPAVYAYAGFNVINAFRPKDKPMGEYLQEKGQQVLDFGQQLIGDVTKQLNNLGVC